MPFNSETGSIAGAKSSRNGSPNKLTKELRIVLKNIIYDEIEGLPDLFAKLDTKDRLDLMIKLLPFVVPKVNNVNSGMGEPVDFDF